MKTFEIGKQYILTDDLYMPSPDRVGWTVTCLELIDEYGKPYLAFKDKLGVTFPAAKKLNFNIKLVI